MITLCILTALSASAGGVISGFMVLSYIKSSKQL